MDKLEPWKCHCESMIEALRLAADNIGRCACTMYGEDEREVNAEISNAQGAVDKALLNLPACTRPKDARLERMQVVVDAAMRWKLSDDWSTRAALRNALAALSESSGSDTPPKKEPA